MNKVLRANIALGGWEMTTITTVADMTLYCGVTGESGKIVVTVDSRNDIYEVEATKQQVQAALALFQWGDEVVGADAYYALLKDVLPEDSDFRFVP